MEPDNFPADRRGLKAIGIAIWRRRGLILALFGLLTLILFAVDAGLGAYVHARYFDCIFNDGCFQFYNPLRRLAAGQHLGLDFQFFYGPGTLFIHYPLYWLLGKNLFASEFTRQILSPVLFFGLITGFFAVLTKRLRPTLIFSAAALLYTAWFAASLPFADNSLAGIRSFLPFLLAVFLLALELAGKKSVKNSLIIGSLAGAAIFASPDQGAIAFIALLIPLACLRFNAPHRWRNLAIIVAATAAVAAVLAVITAGAGAWPSFRFSFVTIPGDQAWYFGAAPNKYLGNYWKALQYLLNNVPLLLTLLGASIAYLCRRKIPGQARLAIGYLVLYGLATLVSLLGYVKDSYADPLDLTALLIFAVTAWYAWPITPEGSSRRGFRKWEISFRTVLAVLLLGGSWSLFMDVLKQANMAAAQTIAPTPLGVTPDVYWTRHRAAAKRALAETAAVPVGDCGVRLWSTYTSMTEAELGIFNPSSDYIIHALGPGARENYVRAFNDCRPAVVRTMDSTNIHEPWVWQMHWPLYETIIANYDLDSRLWRREAVWTRRTGDWKTPGDEWTGEAKVSDDSIIDFPEDGGLPALYTLEVMYRLENPQAWVPILGRTARALLIPVEASNPFPISLPPDGNVVRIPLLVKPVSQRPNGHDIQTAFRARVDGLVPGAKLTILSARWRRLELSPKELQFFFMEYPAPVRSRPAK